MEAPPPETELLERAADEWLETVHIIRRAMANGLSAEAIVARLAQAGYVITKSEDEDTA